VTLSPIQAGLIWAAVLIGVALRVWAYAADSSFWLDEILLARNILTLPLAHLLTEPLYLDQVAPRGFLLVEKLIAGTLGGGELALRLFPFLAGIAGLLLFRRLAERTLGGWPVPFAVGLMAIGIPFIRYAIEVKQYHLDATASILLLLVALSLREREPGNTRLALAALAGFLGPWFSQASVLVMAGIGLAFALMWAVSRDRPTARVLLIVMPVWALSAVIAVAVGRDSMTPSTSEFMQDFWGSGFFPLPLDSVADLRWFLDQALSAFADPFLLRYAWPALYLALAVIGMIRCWRTRRDVALLLLGPLLVALGAAIAQQYPFRGRLMFYLLPGLLIAVAAGAESMRQAAMRLHPAAGNALLAGLLVPPVLAIAESPPPYENEPTRTFLEHLRQHRRPGDAIHLFPLSRIGVLFYGPRYGLHPDEWRTSVCDRNDTRSFLRDLDRYRGIARLWLISSSSRAYRSARAAVRQYLGTIGVRRDSLSFPSLQFGSAWLELYDLSDSTRLRRANAESFPVQPMPTDPRPGCRPWAAPSPMDSFP
jgi:hypothetical protein